MRPSVVQIHASCSIPRALLKRHCSRPSGICIFWGSHQTDPTGPQPSRLWSLYDVTVSTLCPPPGSLGSKDRCRDATCHSQENSYFGASEALCSFGMHLSKILVGTGQHQGNLVVTCCHIKIAGKWIIPAHPASFVPN